MWVGGEPGKFTTVYDTVPLEPLYMGQVGSVRGVVPTFSNKAWVKVKAVMAKFTASLDAGKVDLAEVARVHAIRGFLGGFLRRS